MNKEVVIIGIGELGRVFARGVFAAWISCLSGIQSLFIGNS